MRLLADAGCLPNDFDFEKVELFGFWKCCITTKEFSPREVHMLRASEWDSINFKTQEKRERFAGMFGINMDQLAEWRINTIKDLGIYWPERGPKAVPRQQPRPVSP
jgi:anaerobic magnesium-protoporphyrin IX monomethyl ester cyclase